MKFRKPAGATADLREMEYISALHQTGNEIRRDGSIQAKDISKFLTSRYGIKTTPSEISSTISKGFGGGGISEVDGDIMDLTEVMAMLLIPTLLKVERRLHHRDYHAPNGNGDGTGGGDGGGVKLRKESVARGIAKGVFGMERGYCSDDFIEGDVFDHSSNHGGSGISSRNGGGEDGSDESSTINGKERTERSSSSGPKVTFMNAEEGKKFLADLEIGAISEKHLFKFVLDMILKDVTGDSEPKPITIELLRNIFLFYGEKDVAADEELLEEMVMVASQGARGNENDNNDAADEEEKDEEGGFLLDEHAFAYCLTSDVKLYNLESEKELTTTYFDVFQTFRSTKEVKNKYTKRGKRGQFSQTMHDSRSKDDEEEEVQIVEEQEDVVRLIEKRSTASSIDYAVDSFRSKTFVILLWVTFVIYFMTFMFNETNPELGNIHCENYEMGFTRLGFPCSIGQGVIKWLIVMAKLVIFGTLFICGASTGHSSNPQNPLLVLISLAFIGLYTFFPLFYEYSLMTTNGIVEGAKNDDDWVEAELSTKTNNGDIDEDVRFLRTGLFSCGVMLVALTLQNFFDKIIPARIKNKSSFLKMFLASGTARMERNMKQAANFKIDRMIKNACAIHQTANLEHSSQDTSYGKALLTYSKKADETEEVGGYMWTWKNLRSGDLFSEEGIWLNNRVLQGNLGQIFLCLYLVPFVTFLIEIVNELIVPLWQEATSEAPETWRVMLPVGLAFALAECNALSLVLVYIPSTVRTVLKFRYGVIGSLHDNEFEKMRRQTDQVTFIFSAMFWGCLVSSLLVLVVSFVIIFVLCLKEFQPVLLGIVASVIGLGITIGIKTVVLIGVRKLFHGEAFYRSNPAAANLINVILESWNLGISILFIIVRMVTLVGVAFIYVARVDIPFLSDSADEIGPVVLDRWPFLFRKDLLQHEAHRHPYLERIGVMYMMKLRYGERFGRQANTSWRLLFVFALMPWLRKYRLRSDESINVTKSNINRTDETMPSSVSKIAHDNAICELQTEIDTLREELQRAKAQLVLASTASKDKSGQRSDMVKESSDSEDDHVNTRLSSNNKLNFPESTPNERDDDTTQSPLEVFE